MVRTPVKRGRKPTPARSIRDPGPIVSQWYTGKRELDKALDKVGEIAERMNTLGMLAKTRFEIDLPFVNRNGSFPKANEASPTPTPQSGQYAHADPEFEYVPPAQEPAARRASAPLPVQGHAPAPKGQQPQSVVQGVEITTSPMKVDVGREGNLRAAAANKMAGLQKMLG